MALSKSNVSGAVALVVLTILSLKAVAADLPNGGLYLPFEAELYFHSTYRKNSDHKALAVGPNGVWGYSMGYPTAPEAEERALNECRKSMFAANPLQALSTRCIPFAVDDRSLAPELIVGSPLAAPLNSGGAVLDAATVFEPDGTIGSKTSVIVFIGSCETASGAAIPSILADYFNSRGAVFVDAQRLPISAAKELCGLPDERRKLEATNWIKRKIELSRQIIDSVRVRYPESQVFLWGDGIGGLVATSVSERVEGILVSEWPCAHERLTPPGTPITFLFGDSGFVASTLGLGSTQKQVNINCAEVAVSYDITAVRITDMSGFAFPWRQQVDQSISQLTGLAPLNAQWERMPSDQKLTEKQSLAFQSISANCQGQKAFAVHQKGGYGFACEHGSWIDAANHALYECTKSRGGKPFRGGKTYDCDLFAINDTVYGVDPSNDR